MLQRQGGVAASEWLLEWDRNWKGQQQNMQRVSVSSSSLPLFLLSLRLCDTASESIEEDAMAAAVNGFIVAGPASLCLVSAQHVCSAVSLCFPIGTEICHDVCTVHCRAFGTISTRVIGNANVLITFIR